MHTFFDRHWCPNITNYNEIKKRIIKINSNLNTTKASRLGGNNYFQVETIKRPSRFPKVARKLPFKLTTWIIWLSFKQYKATFLTKTHFVLVHPFQVHVIGCMCRTCARVTCTRVCFQLPNNNYYLCRVVCTLRQRARTEPCRNWPGGFYSLWKPLRFCCPVEVSALRPCRDSLTSIVVAPPDCLIAEPPCNRSSRKMYKSI